MIMTLLGLAPEGWPQNSGWEALFFQANQAYKEGRYDEAIEGYRRLVEAGNSSGHLFYNLGNAYFRSDQLGRAVLNYERARILLPRDADLKFNLDYARDQVLDAVPESQTFMETTFFWLKSLTHGELFWGFAVVNLFFWTVLFVRLFSRAEWTYYLMILFLIFWIIGGLSFGLKWHQTENDHRAVILDPEADVMAGPDSADTLLFKLHAGTIVELERSEDNWSLIRLPDKKRGWIQSKAIESISFLSQRTQRPQE